MRACHRERVIRLLACATVLTLAGSAAHADSPPRVGVSVTGQLSGIGGPYGLYGGELELRVGPVSARAGVGEFKGAGVRVRHAQGNDAIGISVGGAYAGDTTDFAILDSVLLFDAWLFNADVFYERRAASGLRFRIHLGFNEFVDYDTCERRTHGDGCGESDDLGAPYIAVALGWELVERSR